MGHCGRFVQEKMNGFFGSQLASSQLASSQLASCRFTSLPCEARLVLRRKKSLEGNPATAGRRGQSVEGFSAIEWGNGRRKIGTLPGGGHSCPLIFLWPRHPLSDAAGQECPASLDRDTF